MSENILREALLPCPFCGGTDISEGEVESQTPSGVFLHQSMCRGCGALGPEGQTKDNGPDYGAVAANTAWNRRAALGAVPEGAGKECPTCHGVRRVMDEDINGMRWEPCPRCAGMAGAGEAGAT